MYLNRKADWIFMTQMKCLSYFQSGAQSFEFPPSHLMRALNIYFEYKFMRLNYWLNVVAVAVHDQCVRAQLHSIPLFVPRINSIIIDTTTACVRRPTNENDFDAPVNGSRNCVHIRRRWIGGWQQPKRLGCYLTCTVMHQRAIGSQHSETKGKIQNDVFLSASDSQANFS